MTATSTTLGLLALALAGGLGCQRTHVLGVYDAGSDAANRSDATDAKDTADATDTSDARPDVAPDADVPPDVASERADDGGPDAAPDADEAESHPIKTVIEVVACATECTSAGFTCAGDICQDGVSRWPTLGGDVHHSGFNANEKGHPPLTFAWTANLPAGGLSPAISDGGPVFVTSNGGAQTEANSLSAVSTTDGKLLWSHPFDANANIGQPSIDHGRIYAARCGFDGVRLMYAFSATNGSPTWMKPIECQNEQYWAPLVVGPAVYTNGGQYGGLYGFATADGAPLFVNTHLPQQDQWSPMFLRDALFTFLGGYLKSLDPITGDVLFSTGVGNDNLDVGSLASPTSDGERIYVVSKPALIAYRPGELNPAWSIVGDYSGMVALADGVAYAISGGQLRAHDAKTGDVLWTYPADSHLSYPPIVAGHWVYVSSNDSVFAVDTTTQDKAWKGSPGGWLSIANGQLYVSQSDGKLVAYNLTR